MWVGLGLGLGLGKGTPGAALPVLDVGAVAFVGLPTLATATSEAGPIELHVNGVKVADMVDVGGGLWEYEWTPAAADADAELQAVRGGASSAIQTVVVAAAAQQWTLGNGTGDPLSVSSDVGGNAATATSTATSPTLSIGDADFAGEDALVFDGGDYLPCGASNSTGYIHDGTGGTLAVTFHTDHTGGLTYVYGQRLGGNGRGLQIGHNNGSIYLVLANGSAQIATPSVAAAVNTTHTLVWRLDGSAYTVWLDDPDTPAASGTCSAAPTTGPSAGVPTIGARSTGTAPFVGKQAFVAAFDSALSDAQVAALIGEV